MKIRILIFVIKTIDVQPRLRSTKQCKLRVCVTNKYLFKTEYFKSQPISVNRYQEELRRKRYKTALTKYNLINS